MISFIQLTRTRRTFTKWNEWYEGRKNKFSWWRFVRWLNCIVFCSFIRMFDDHSGQERLITTRCCWACSAEREENLPMQFGRRCESFPEYDGLLLRLRCTIDRPQSWMFCEKRHFTYQTEFLKSVLSTCGNNSRAVE